MEYKLPCKKIILNNISKPYIKAEPRLRRGSAKVLFDLFFMQLLQS